MYTRSPWSHLPRAICEQAQARWPSGPWAAGPGDGHRYHWVVEEPADDYRGPLPVGRLIKRTWEGR